MPITNLQIAASAASTAVPSGEGGFIHAIFRGDDLASNVQENRLIATFGSTSVIVRPGQPIPGGATIANTNTVAFNVLINN